jgi:hypothetical protein
MHDDSNGSAMELREKYKRELPFEARISVISVYFATCFD